MVSPVGESLLVKYMYKSCEITMADKEMVIDLIMLDMLEFNVILGIHLLANYHDTLDCHLKMIKFNLLGELTFHGVR